MKNFEIFVLDVDGVMTDGKFYYSQEGKIMKVFGADDNDALTLLSQFISIIFITGDSKGYNISKKRISDDMGYPLNLVSTVKRLEWINSKYDLKKTIYMGDGIFDHYVMKHVGYSIAPANADSNCKKYANYVTNRSGSERSVAEACLHIMEKFFKKYDPEEKINSDIKLSGKWSA